jgi:alpha-N-acetylglucosaminidase
MRGALSLALSFAVLHAARSQDALVGLVERVLGPEFVPQISFQLIPADPSTGFDVWEYESDQGQLVVRGNTGVAMASGLYAYLGRYLNGSVTWSGNHFSLPPDGKLPLPSSPERTTRAFRHSYSWNVCTFGYTSTFWDWSRWEQELDWLALHGVNLPLAFVGQELVWQSLWRELGLSDEEISGWFSGPAFLPWQRMGNIQGWGGPLDQDWIEGQANLQLQILQRMTEFGMNPVMPGFSGHVPRGLRTLFPHANIGNTSAWGHFNSTYTVIPFLDPMDPLFQNISIRFYQIQRAVFGKYPFHYYNVDQFNEVDPPTNATSYLKAANQAVWDSMVSVDPEATYVMQAWVFHGSFWNSSLVQAYLSGVPLGKLLVLDLNAEQEPLWQKFDSFFGHDFVWNALHNYGGRAGIYGNLTTVATAPPLVKVTMPNATIAGTGFTPEAILQNPVYYELVTLMSWMHAPVSVDSYLEDWTRRRYQFTDPTAQQRMSQVWSTLKEAVYSANWYWEPWSVLEHAPNTTMDVAQLPGSNATLTCQALRFMAQAALDGGIDTRAAPFRYDLVNLARQVVSNVMGDTQRLSASVLEAMVLQHKNVSVAFEPLATSLLSMAQDMESLLATNENFLLGSWLHEAVHAPTTPNPDLIPSRLFNARNQITLWGPSGQINDYASKQWSGLTGSYYQGRWQLFTDTVTQTLQSGQSFNFTQFEASLLAWEQEWDTFTNLFPDEPTGSDLEQVQNILSKYVNAPAQVKAMFKAQPGVDYGGNDMLEGGAWSNDVDQLALLCARTPACVGFNWPGGFVKNATGKAVTSPGSVFYSKL